jgi:hypothetical protein
MNPTFLFKSIRKYNVARRRTQKDVILHAVGVHCKLLENKRSPLPTLSEAEREVVLNFLRDFLRSENLEKISLKD